MRFLVTGGAGFIGSHITERLLKEGHFVRVLDNFSSGKRENLSFTQYPIRTTRQHVNSQTRQLVNATPNTQNAPTRKLANAQTQYSIPNTQYELIEGDIRSKETCDKACEDIDYILHQAALRSVPKSLEDPESYNEVNIGGTLNMLQAAAKHKVKRLVLASSSSVYGDTTKFPEQETDYPLLISPYALSKLAGEYYCRIYSEHFGLETVCLRYFNVFGPRQALDDEYAVVIPKFIHCILHDEQPPIFGTGKQSRDFTYIDNVVEANILAATVQTRQRANAPTQYSIPNTQNAPTRKRVNAQTRQRNTQYSILNTKHDIFNVANGNDNTVLELVALINKILGKNIQPQFLPLRAGDVFRTLADISKIESKLGFKSKVNFEEGLRRTVSWFNDSLTRKLAHAPTR